MTDSTEGVQDTAAGAGNQITGTQQGAATPAATQAEERKFSQADLDRLIDARLAEERKRQQAKAEKERQRLDDEAKAKQGEFQTLAEQRAAKIAELEAQLDTVSSQSAALADAIGKDLDRRLRALPEEIRALAPQGDIAARYAWLGQAEQAAAKLVAQRTPGTPAGPRGAGTVTTSEAAALEREIERLRGSGKYTPL